MSPPTEAERPSISFIYREGLDPWAYDLLLTIDEVDSNLEMQLVYPSTSISQEKAKEVARNFETVMNILIDEVKYTERLVTIGDILRIIKE